MNLKVRYEHEISVIKVATEGGTGAVEDNPQASAVDQVNRWRLWCYFYLT